jgi:hypothetical protein
MIAAIALARRFWVSRDAVREWIVWAATLTAVVLLSAGLWVLPSVRFFLRQLHAARDLSEPRPGFGYYLGLYDARCALSSAWGFWAPGDWWGAGDRCAPLALVVFLTVTAAVFTACLAFGIVRFVRNRDYVLPLALAVILGGAAYMAISEHYDYGAYKFMSTGWFVIAMITMEGVIAAASLVSAAPVMAGAAVLLIMVLPQTMILTTRWVRFDTRHAGKTLEIYRKAAEVRDIVGDAPLIVAMRDTMSVQWFVFVLRDMKLTLPNRPHPYFHHFDTRDVLLARRRGAIGKVQWVATDDTANLACRGFRLVWQGGPYRLWKSDVPSDIFARELAAPKPSHAELPELSCPAG